MLTEIQIACQTKFTRIGERDMRNKKPYRTKAQKKVAREVAVKTKGGFFIAAAPVSYHK